jgi:hypothetical protein
MIATQELVVPRSIPMTFAILNAPEEQIPNQLTEFI